MRFAQGLSLPRTLLGGSPVLPPLLLLRRKRAPNPTATSNAIIRPALMPVVPRDSLAAKGVDATVGEEASVSTGFGSATPAALPLRTRDASDVGKAGDAPRAIASEAGPATAMAASEAITGATAEREVVSTDLAIA